MFTLNCYVWPCLQEYTLILNVHLYFLLKQDYVRNAQSMTNLLSVVQRWRLKLNEVPEFTTQYTSDNKLIGLGILYYTYRLQMYDLLFFVLLIKPFERNTYSCFEYLLVIICLISSSYWLNSTLLRILFTTFWLFYVWLFFTLVCRNWKGTI